MLIETSRLILRPLTLADEPALAAVLSDAETMYWYRGRTRRTK
jgi:RimJ/RimL family protein N-acetyltransferase